MLTAPLPEKIELKDRDYIPDSSTISVFKQQGPLKAIRLLKTGFLKRSRYPLTTEYTKFAWMGGLVDAAFIGQANHLGMPEGIVRVIRHNGCVYEGQINSRGEFHGFGRDIFNKDSEYSNCYIGWWSHNTFHGNGIDMCYYHGKGDDIQDQDIDQQGWFVNDEYRGDYLKSSPEYFIPR